MMNFNEKQEQLEEMIFVFINLDVLIINLNA